MIAPRMTLVLLALVFLVLGACFLVAGDYVSGPSLWASGWACLIGLAVVTFGVRE